MLLTRSIKSKAKTMNKFITVRTIEKTMLIDKSVRIIIVRFIGTYESNILGNLIYLVYFNVVGIVHKSSPDNTAEFPYIERNT